MAVQDKLVKLEVLKLVSDVANAAKKAAVVNGNASGSIATFTDGADDVPMESVVATIDPVQNLHGYENPWPAGGGKNLLPIPGEGNTINGITFTVNANGTINVNGTATADAYFNLYSGTIALQAGDYASLFSDENVNVSLQLRIGDSSGSDVMGSATTTHRNVTVSSTTNVIGRLRVANGVTVSNVTVYPMLALQSAALSVADFEPYANICPISGRTGLSVTRAGKNLTDIGDFSLVMGTNRTKGKTLPQMLPAGDYIVSFDVTANTATKTTKFTVMTASGGTTVANQNITAGSTGHYVKTFTADKPFGSFYVFLNVQETDSNSVTFANVQLEPGSTATAYEPYNGDTYAIDWETEAGTVYSGTLDVLAGVLTVDRAYTTIGSLTWTRSSNYARFESQSVKEFVKAPASNGTALPGLICSMYETGAATKTGSNFSNNVIAVAQTKTLYISSEDYSDVSTWLSAVGNESIVYPLAIPQTYQLTPQQISSLLGENNVFANSGDTAVVYAADTGMHTTEEIGTKIRDFSTLIAPVEDAYTATRAYESGDLFIVNNTLYKATASIANGGTITPDTNCTATTLAAIIAALN